MTDEPYVGFIYSVYEHEGNSTPSNYDDNMIATLCNFDSVRQKHTSDANVIINQGPGLNHIPERILELKFLAGFLENFF